MCVHVYVFPSGSPSFFLDFIMDAQMWQIIYLRKDHERGLRKIKEK